MVEAKESTDISKDFNCLQTMVHKDVLAELTAIAKEYGNFKGYWDYGTVFRELLWMRKVFVNVNTRLDELEQLIKEYQMEQVPTVEDTKKEEDNFKPGYDNDIGLMGRQKKEK